MTGRRPGAGRGLAAGLRRREAEFRTAALARLARALGDRLGRPRLHLPELAAEVTGDPVLAIAPHPDDDILAVGGILARHARLGHRVVTLVLTDGARGHAGRRPDPELAVRRQAEARAAAAVLGVTEVRFAGLADGALDREGTAAVIESALSEIAPAAVYLPFPLDYHRDHLAAAAGLCRAAARGRFDPELRCYECVAPIIPNRLVDITDLVDLKERAIRCFESQMAQVDYVNTIVHGLNRFRSFALMQGRGHAEALFVTGPAFLARLLAILGEPV